MSQCSEGEAKWVLEGTCGSVVMAFVLYIHVEGVRNGEEERKGKGVGGREMKTRRHPPARTFCASSLSRSMALSSDRH